MSKKQSKFFLLSQILLFFVAFLVSAGIVFGLQISGRVAISLGMGQCWLLALACALAPLFVYNGFVAMLSRIGELSSRNGAVFVLLVLPMVLVVVPVGAVMLVPNNIKAIKIILDKL